MLAEMLRAEALFGSSSVQIRTVSGSGIDIANKTKSRIESRDRMRTEPWLESSVELKLEPRTCSESEQGTVPRSEIRAGLLNPVRDRVLD
ncbi:hypothetical protein EVAR_28044_1 [Eumeta japonica]|uniref:Uncharacterized protein n=1 Tax=Eumeta variegata TaxID=151549 RepID=A0A4C1W8J7_EUMVA|nr:hypothetical protein EVAR_28044_1 [Eumeta japonica]